MIILIVGAAVVESLKTALTQAKKEAEVSRAAVGILEIGVPRLACLRPAAWLKEWPSMAHLHQQTLKTLVRVQASRGGRHKASSGAASPGRLTRRQRDQGEGYLARPPWRKP